MKKHTTQKDRPSGRGEVTEPRLLTLIQAKQSGQPVAAQLHIGLDQGDRASCYCVLDEEGTVIGRGGVPTDEQALRVKFESFPPSVVALEVETHSPWISRLLQELGHEPRARGSGG